MVFGNFFFSFSFLVYKKTSIVSKKFQTKRILGPKEHLVRDPPKFYLLKEQFMEGKETINFLLILYEV